MLSREFKRGPAQLFTVRSGEVLAECEQDHLA